LFGFGEPVLPGGAYCLFESIAERILHAVGYAGGQEPGTDTEPRREERHRVRRRCSPSGFDLAHVAERVSTPCRRLLRQPCAGSQVPEPLDEVHDCELIDWTVS